jgi:hypothetical protein
VGPMTAFGLVTLAMRRASLANSCRGELSLISAGIPTLYAVPLAAAQDAIAARCRAAQRPVPARHLRVRDAPGR